MTTLRKAIRAALKSLRRGKTYLLALLAYLSHSNGRFSRRYRTPAGPTANRDSSSSSLTATPPTKPVAEVSFPRTLEDFLCEAEELFLAPVQGDRLRQFSSQLKQQLHSALVNNTACMLPSYNHQLPSGQERGRYLSLDVGGSTLLVALIELSGCQDDSKVPNMRIIRISTFKITPEVKELPGTDFFDWIAERIIETLDSEARDGNSPLLLGLAWSFPLQQTSLRGGLLQGMGKGFRAADSLMGQDLGGIIQQACSRHGLNVELAAIINDSAAALLSESYHHTTTRFGLVLGTGVNMAAYLPVPSVGRAKFGSRPSSWYEQASHVIVNTELSMFGHGILPVTRWDQLLNTSHQKPDFQPLEQLVSGYYLGEVCRLVLVEAVSTAGLLHGAMPSSLLKPYSLDTETLSIIEQDQSESLSYSISVFQERHPSVLAPTRSDISAIRTLASFISQRSAAIISGSVYALWELKAEVETEFLRSLANKDCTNIDVAKRHECTAQNELSIESGKTVVAFNGSVIERYPGYLERCQQLISDLLAGREPSPDGPVANTACSPSISLVLAQESSLLGAAVALACLE